MTTYLDSKVLIYSRPTCSQCNQLKAWMDSHHYKYTSINIDEDDDARSELINEGATSLPVVMVVAGDDITTYAHSSLNELRQVIEDFYE